MNNNPFTGTVRVSASRAQKAALECIRHIERKRNLIFEFNINNIKDTGMKWYTPGYLFNIKTPHKWFRPYKRFSTRKEVIDYILYETWIDPNEYGRKEYRAALNMLDLIHNDYIYISPEQGNIISKSENKEYDLA